MSRELVGIKAQDILLLAKLIASDGFPMQKILSQELGISPSEISHSMRRLNASGLINLEGKSINRLACIEFFEHAVKFFFPIEISSIERGVLTGPSFKGFKFQSEMDYVWSDSFGDARGLSVTPLYPTVPFASKTDDKLYELMCVIDILRGLGKVRHQKEAKELLRRTLLRDEKVAEH